MTRRPILEFLCNTCETRAIFRTRTEALAGMIAHELATGHSDMLWSGPHGWTRYVAQSWDGCFVNAEGRRI